MHIGVTGSSGLIGSALLEHLRAGGHQTTRIVRRAAGAGEISWDPTKGDLDPGALAGLDAVVHLAGAGIGDHRWTDEYRRTLLDSRVDSTKLLAEAMAAADGPRVLISGSAIGVYGDRDDEQLDEASSSGDGFLADICRAWEAATAPAEAAGIRVAHIRTGIVLSREGGALKKMLPLFRLGLGGRFGNGRQWMSWISIDDEVRAIEHLLTSGISGPVNLTAPEPVRNADFAKTLGKALGRPSFLPVPTFGPKLVLGGDLAEALLFSSQRVAPSVLVEDGFAFEHPELLGALRAILTR
ncbi:MAG: TIGR01777 family oxidoreductase [Ilumatobacter sp.]|uniref:TIGR01777 family oxidoreductase n=1 Tax=Ilumatobacter sp. TaxID=1967498 RepID=UPI00262E96F1|nr:TIGR01777 family oxidoreductase [Ilumatobacter sp.]MDJ0770805.1 TIGR01777 family oxidoreductase [Ilumatobacter sp.]